MYPKKSRVPFVTGIACLFMMGAFCTIASGEQPELQWREFILLAPLGGTVDDLPDIEAKGSQILVTHPPAGDPGANQSVPVTFIVGDDPSKPYVEEFFGTTWYYFGEATHATAAGPATYRFFWKDALPPTGAVARTGPEGQVMTEFYWLREAPGEDISGNGTWVAEYVQTSADSRLFLHGAGWFSR